MRGRSATRLALGLALGWALGLALVLPRARALALGLRGATPLEILGALMPLLRSATLLPCSLALVVGCAVSAPTPGPAAVEQPTDAPRKLADDPIAADATQGVEAPELAELLADHWRARLEASPSFATYLGVPGYDDRWGERSAEARSAAAAQRRAFLARAQSIAAAQLGEDDSVTLALFTAELEAAIASEACEFWAWSVGTGSNPLTTINGIADVQRVDTPVAGEALLARYRAVPALIDAEIADLREGLSRGWVADAATLERVIAMVEGQLAAPLADWPTLTPLARVAAAEDPAWTAEARERFEQQLREAVEGELRPALARYVALLRDELLPAGRGPERVGVGALPFGASCYAAQIFRHTSERPTADALHELGLAEIARIDRELEALGERVLGTADLAQILVRLRSDPELYFADPEAIEAAARATLAEAQAAAPAFFGRLPTTPCEVRPIPDYQAPYTYVAYYRQPGDGQPGIYFVNTSAPTTRPRFQARVLAVHESVPGHHLQIALARELPQSPAFRRYAGYSAFVEGWALYSERLGEAMGLYRDDLDRLGVLSFDAWRAARLVVDTGLHARGWTRAEAEAFLYAHTALSPNNIANEVDRYVAWPGQALAYKYGQLRILALRERAEARLASAFELPAFHDLVLGAGAVTLPVLEARVDAWIERTLHP